ncbi:MAG: carbohydrate kinase [Prevotellaceae bacterium]|jgi:xylulokinase|nr:carbohydrate kinase [Prevotellaceae bacterium]
MYLLGCDIGSSSVKASIVDQESGLTVASDFYPKEEAPITTLKSGWAEQNPDDWWSYLKMALKGALHSGGIDGRDIRAIGISYQMHGLVTVDKNLRVLRPSIIWCDSRAVPYGDKAFAGIGAEHCLSRLLNSPGNFTAAKLAWVKENEPALFAKIHKIMLPGDYIAMCLTGEPVTTVSGLSEGILWDFKSGQVSDDILKYFGFDHSLIPSIVPTFGPQGELLASAAAELGLQKGTPVTYRAGDQPNNALSLNVLNPGEIAATAGTSGVVYGVNDKINYDKLSRVNTFAHVNHSAQNTRLGILLCINGVGILNSWIKRNVALENMSYNELNNMAASVPAGSDGLTVVPFGNGAERMLGNRETDCTIAGLNFNIHTRSHLVRAAQEGIVYSFKYGIDIMNEMGLNISVIRAGNANMFLSPVFRNTLANISGAIIELYDTNGAVGAAKGAGIGAGIYKSEEEAFANLRKLAVVEPAGEQAACIASYGKWLEKVKSLI